MSPSGIKALAAWRPGMLARNTAHAVAWTGLRVVLQAFNLVLLARVFGPGGYGALAGSVALYMTLATVVGLGTGTAMFRQVVREGAGASRLGVAVAIHLGTGVSLFVVAWPLSTWLLPVGPLGPGALALLALAELVVAPALVPIAQRYQAVERLFVTSALLTVAPAARCLAVLSALALPHASLTTFAALYLGWLVAAVGFAARAGWPLGDAAPRAAGARALVSEGLPYSVSNFAVTAGAELDKTLMLRFAGDLLTGQYAAASRVVQAALLPVSALVIAAAPRWFRRDAGGLAGSVSLFGATLGYAVLTAAALWLLGPYLPLLLGHDFEPSVAVLRLLTGAVLTGALRQVLMLLLAATDQRARNRTEVAATLAGVVPMPLLITHYGPTGAVLCVLLADLVAISLGFLALRRRRR